MPTDETKAPMDDKCRLCGEPRPAHINHLWACCGDGPGYRDEIKPEAVACLRRQLTAAQAELEKARAERARLCSAIDKNASFPTPESFHGETIDGRALAVEHTGKLLADLRVNVVPAAEAALKAAEGERDRFHDDYWSRVRECDALTGKLQAAERELELLRRIEDIVRLWNRRMHALPTSATLRLLDELRASQQPATPQPVGAKRCKQCNDVLGDTSVSGCMSCHWSRRQPAAADSSEGAGGARCNCGKPDHRHRSWCSIHASDLDNTAAAPPAEPTKHNRLGRNSWVLGTCRGCGGTNAALFDGPFCCKLCRRKHEELNPTPPAEPTKPKPHGIDLKTFLVAEALREEEKRPEEDLLAEARSNWVDGNLSSALWSVLLYLEGRPTVAGAPRERGQPEVDHLKEARDALDRQPSRSLEWLALVHVVAHLESRPTVAQEVARLSRAAIDDSHPTSIVGAPLTRLAEAAEREAAK